MAPVPAANPTPTQAKEPVKMRKPQIAKSPVVRMLLMVGSFLCLGLAALGVFLPILPTTPFVILAAYLYSKSSERWFYWLVDHKVFGPPLRRWYATGAITPKAKYMALAMIAATFTYSIGFVIDKMAIKILLACIGLGVSLFLYRLPESTEDF